MSDHLDELARAVGAVPAGLVTTYGAVARAIGTTPRAVGRLLAVHGGELTWWRVVNASGELPAHTRERALERYLEEGTALARSSPGELRVDLKVARWSGLR